VQAQIAITCPQCGALVPSGYKFCSRCGAAIETWVCWRCQSPVPEERKFCGRCGAPRQPPAAIVCPRCAYKNPLGRKFCGKCGELLKQP
jgi:predicted amidophosphoribosyltransferase